MKCALFLISSLLALNAVNGATTHTPVERVVNLLKDLQTKLTNDEKVEQQVYDKYACWCETTTARKADSINQADADLRMLGQTILKLKGKIATLTAEIEQLAKDIKTNLEEQAEATSVRAKENAAWQAESAETKQALAAMQQAITVLVEATTYDKKEGAALVQQQAKAKSAVAAAVDVMPQKSSYNKPDQVALLSEFLGSTGSSKYAPQSFTVQGILKDMYDTFATDLETATNTEATQNRDFEDFIAVKTSELNQMEASKKEKEGQKAEAESQLADTQQVYDDTMEQKKADIKFFDETKEACEAKHEAWTTRSSLRMEELAGVEKAIEILTTDAARELFASAIKPGKETGMDARDTGRDIAPAFLQVDNGAPNMHAYAKLKAMATKTHSLRLAALAIKVRNSKVGHFDKVVKAIDDMIQTLKDEEAADIAKRDQCKSEYLKIESTIKNVTWLIEKNEAKIDKLTKLIMKREDQKAKTIEEIADVEKQMADMTTQREAENAAFKVAKAEDQGAIDLLMQARDALSAYYKNNKIEMGEVQGSVKLLQQEPEFAVSEDQAPDATFSSSGKRKNESKGIVSILTMVIEDLNDEIKNGMKNEEASQLEYEGMMDAANKLKEELIARKDSLESAIAKRSQERTDEELDKQENEADLKDEETYKAQIKPDCDWIIGAFYKREKARAAEMEGLVSAKDFLAGQQAFVQKGAAFDDNALSNTKFLGLRK